MPAPLGLRPCFGGCIVSFRACYTPPVQCCSPVSYGGYSSAWADPVGYGDYGSYGYGSGSYSPGGYGDYGGYNPGGYRDYAGYGYGGSYYRGYRSGFGYGGSW